MSPGMKKKIRQGQYDFPSPEWSNVSKEARNLIEGMLCIDPAQRLQIDDVIRNKWIAVRTYYRYAMQLAHFVINLQVLHVYLLFTEIHGGACHSLAYRTRFTRGWRVLARGTGRDDAIVGDDARGLRHGETEATRSHKQSAAEQTETRKRSERGAAGRQSDGGFLGGRRQLEDQTELDCLLT